MVPHTGKLPCYTLLSTPEFFAMAFMICFVVFFAALETAKTTGCRVAHANSMSRGLNILS